MALRDRDETETALRMLYIVGLAVSFLIPTSALADSTAASTSKPDDGVVVLEKFVANDKGDDPLSMLPAPTAGLFGMEMSALDTPRSYTSISGETMEQFDVSHISDLTQLAPSTYTSFSFGIQGGIDIRNAPADAYFMGMRRVVDRSSIPTALGATDGIEIVRGPPSPIYGDGQIGGYLNYMPKSSRARSGQYLTADVGKMSLEYGSYNERVLTAEAGGPAHIMDHPAGYYIYSQFVNSGSFYHGGFERQELVQATFNVDLSKSLRMEAGTMLQQYEGVGIVGWNRVTQQLINDGTYVAGTPLVNLATDGSSAITLAELKAAGGIIKTIPYSALGHPSLLPALGPAYALDPATVHTVHIQPDQVILEPFLRAHDEILFADLIFDGLPSFHITNKLYAEHLEQDKYNNLSFTRHQEDSSMEDKIIAEEKEINPDGWISFANVYSVNYRVSDNEIGTSSQNQIYSRDDLTTTLTPNQTIGNTILDPATYPWGSVTRSWYQESGLGVLSNVHFGSLPIALTLGGRYDYINAITETPALVSTGAAAASASNYQSAKSGSASLDFTYFKNVRPYVTLARESVLITGNGGEMPITTVRKGPFDYAGLFEAGIKTSLFKDKLFASGAYYQQERKSFDSDAGLATDTVSTGAEMEIRYVPIKSLSLSVMGNWQKTVYAPLVARTYTISPEVAGYTETAADAGQIAVSLPATGDYSERAGYPDRSLALLGTYFAGSHWIFSGSVTSEDSFAADVMKAIILPSANIVNCSVSYKLGRVVFRLSANNLTDERYFKANTPDSAGGVTVLPMPGRTEAIKCTYTF